MRARLRALRGLLVGAEPASNAELLSRLAAIERRLEELESALEGLQDAVYRDNVRHDKQTAELRRRTQPAEMARALSEDARERGL